VYIGGLYFGIKNLGGNFFKMSDFYGWKSFWGIYISFQLVAFNLGLKIGGDFF
jgi:hypothetical protein